MENEMDLTTGSLDISAIEEPDENLEVKQFVCDICNYSSNRKTNLVRHSKVHRPAEETPSTSTPKGKRLVSTIQKPTYNIFCDQCGKSYKTRYGLNLHLLSHENKFKHVCSVCNKGYNQTVQFRFHCMGHQKLSSSKCTYCKKSFQGHSSLQRHIKICLLNPDVKVDVHKFSCDDCALDFATKERLQSHKNGKHGIPRYMCDTCGKTYAWRSSLHYHKNVCK